MWSQLTAKVLRFYESGLTLTFSNQLEEIIKQIPAVMWPRSRFRVILHRKRWLILHSNTLYGIIVKVQVSNLYICSLFYGLWIHPKSMILRCDLALPC